MPVRLSVNLNKVALIRNARGSNHPDLIQFAKDCEEFGAQGITVHPRPDERHVRFEDLPLLKEVVTTEFNIEGNPTPHFIQQVLEVNPHQVTLVPDAPDALTSDAGWDTIKYKDFLTDVIFQFKNSGIRVSLFIDPDNELIAGAKEVGADRIEFYTGPYADHYFENREKAIIPFVSAAKYCQSIGMGINAGHDLNLDNLNYFCANVPYLQEVSIGHALINDALYYGISNVLAMYLFQINKSR